MTASARGRRISERVARTEQKRRTPRTESVRASRRLGQARSGSIARSECLENPGRAASHRRARTTGDAEDAARARPERDPTSGRNARWLAVHLHRRRGSPLCESQFLAAAPRARSCARWAPHDRKSSTIVCVAQSVAGRAGLRARSPRTVHSPRVSVDSEGTRSVPGRARCAVSPRIDKY